MFKAVLGLLASATPPPKTRPEPPSAFAEGGSVSPSSASSMASKPPKSKPSLGGSATLGTLASLPGAIWTDASATAATTAANTASALAALHSLFSTTIPAATLSAFAFSGSAAFASYIALASYFEAITATGPNKPRSWLCLIPDPQIFLQGFSALHALKGSACYTAGLCAIGAAQDKVKLMSTSPAQLEGIYATIDPNNNKPSHLQARTFILNNFEAASPATLGDFLVRIASSAKQTNLLIHKGMVKSAMQQLVKQLAHLRHLLDKAASAYARPTGRDTWTTLCNVSKPFRSAICPSNHSPIIRINKLAFQWLLCNILMTYHGVLLRSFISRLHAESPYVVAFNALNPMSRPSELSPETFSIESSDDESPSPPHVPQRPSSLQSIPMPSSLQPLPAPSSSQGSGLGPI